MKKTLLILLAIIFAINLNTQAQYFSSVYNGDTIYYNITSSTSPRTVEVILYSYSGVVSIPDSVHYNGNYYKVTAIGDNAFEFCTGLTSVIIPNSVTSIGFMAFFECSNLTTVAIPNSVTSIGAHAFIGTPFYNNKPNGVVYINNVLYKYKGTMPANTSINIQSGTVSISDCAFRYCTGLTSITIPNSITSIGWSTFEGCSGLTSITIPNSVTSIGSLAFSYCRGLTYITIPNTVTSIEFGAFSGCSGLTSITIPNSITSISDAVFDGCSGLTSVTIPSSVTSIGYYAFYNCSGLTSITIPNSVTSIGEAAFYECLGLTSITIPNSVTSIGCRAFYSCTGLTSIIIGTSVTSIDIMAFRNCSSLTSITCLATTPPILNSNDTYDSDNSFVFYDVPKTIPVYVPCESLSAYQSAPQWNDFNLIQCISLGKIASNEIKTILYPNPTEGKAKLEVEGLNSDAEVMVYDMIGRVVQKHTIHKGNKELDIDLSGYAKGVYSIRIMNDSINQTKKLIVQ
ncbi:MAG: leucine-rich repeat domain-containing protein [Bacteroidales bacterium]|nr:leucine-rich repeat domain-containing protein [Bacteroidales bacterium]